MLSHNYWTAKTIRRGEINKKYGKKFSGLLPTLYLSGRGTIIPREVFEKIGFFDNVSFKHYAADYDFSLRAKYAGYELFVNSDTPVFSPFEKSRVGSIGQSIPDFIKSFFHIKSPIYIPITYKFSRRHHPHTWYLIFYLTILNSRIFLGYFSRLMAPRSGAIDQGQEHA